MILFRILPAWLANTRPHTPTIAKKCSIVKQNTALLARFTLHLCYNRRNLRFLIPLLSSAARVGAGPVCRLRHCGLRAATPRIMRTFHGTALPGPRQRIIFSVVHRTSAISSTFLCRLRSCGLSDELKSPISQAYLSLPDRR